jgi:outer membrane receptor protein involved in Fe transport
VRLKFLLLLVLSSPVFSHETIDEIEVVEHTDDRPLSRIKTDSVVKNEVVTKTRIEHKNANSIARAVDLEPGVQTTMTCANCGSQRITLNGLRGENTTVLIDGIPAFSSVSSFYGMEAAPVVGLSSIEVMRGAGASLTAPEAIGGSVNLITVIAEKDSFMYQVRGGENNYFNQQILGTYKTKLGGFALAAQTGQMDHFDIDENGVSEAPYQNQKSMMFKYNFRESAKWRGSLRGGLNQLEMIGGSTVRFRNGNPTAAEPNDFPTGTPDVGDVRRRFTGTQNMISDWIRLRRLDGAGSLTYHLSSDTTFKGSFSLAQQLQHSVYMHGYDYDNRDNFRFFDLKANHVLSDAHFLTVGVDRRNEEMISKSKTLYQTNNFPKDDFEFDTLGLYIQDEWIKSEKDEFNFVLRIDRMQVDWTDSQLTNGDLKETAFAPRVHYKRIHDREWSSRFSLGVGYRAPLSLFESQHGTNDEGFKVGITKLERAQTFTYTINQEQERSSFAGSISLTRLENMAYGDDSVEPLVFKNYSTPLHIGTFNLLKVKKMTNNWTLESSFDWFVMPDSYKERLPIAAQETRARLVSDYHFGKNEIVVFMNIVGPRDLSKYHYDRNFNVNDVSTLSDVVSQQKDQKSPLFYTFDMYYSRQVSKSTQLQLGVNNLLDFTQTKDGESPLAWRVHGDHAHLDNRHLWGPTQGRYFWAGFKAEI